MGLFGFGGSSSSGVNLSQLRSALQKEFDGIEFTEKSRTDDKVEITADITAKKYFDDDISVRIVAYKSGTCHVFMVFDHLDATYDNLCLINDYNDHSSFLSAYISEKKGGNYLELHGSSMDAPNTKVLAETIAYLMNEILNENGLKYLQPLSRATY